MINNPVVCKTTRGVYLFGGSGWGPMRRQFHGRMIILLYFVN